MEITDLRDITRIIDRFARPTLETLPRKLKNKERLISKFHQLILNTDIKTDIEVAQKLYGTTVLTGRYSFLKSNYTKLALNTLLDLNLKQSGLSKIAQVRYVCERNYFLISTIIKNGAHGPAMRMAWSTYRLAKKYELALICSEVLILICDQLSHSGKITQYQKYWKEYEKQRTIYNYEINAIHIEYQVRIRMVKWNVADPKSLPFVEKAVADLKKIFTIVDNFKIRMSYYRTLYTYYRIKGDFDKVNEVCREALSWQSKYPTLTFPFLEGQFAVFMLEASIFLRDRKMAQDSSYYCERSLTQGSNSWFVYVECLFIFKMQMGDLEDAAAIFKRVTTHPRFETQREFVREKWGLYSTYIDYLVHINEISSVAGQAKRAPLLRYRKYRDLIRHHPTHGKDKRGRNVSVIILNILILLESKKYVEIVEQIDGLATYRKKYLSDTDSPHSASFFKLLIIMIKENFDLKRIKLKAEYHINILNKAIFTPFDLSESLQILPYSWVWSRMEYLLSKRR